MTDQTAHDVTDDDRRQAYEWAKSVESNLDTWGGRLSAPARVILNAVPTPPLPTMAYMTEEERAACQWMQCDAGPYGRRGLIVGTGEWAVYVVDKETGAYLNHSPDLVIPRPDLPRMEWNGTDQKPEGATTVKVGDVIESTDDPRLDALPEGSVLLDRDNDAVTKRDETWEGAGYHPIPDEGDGGGPWKVINIGQEDDQ